MIKPYNRLQAPAQNPDVFRISAPSNGTGTVPVVISHPLQIAGEASWISPGPEAPEAEDHPSDDSIDDLIRSSSDSGKNWAGLGVSVMLVIVCDLFVFLFDR